MPVKVRRLPLELKPSTTVGFTWTWGHTAAKLYFWATAGSSVSVCFVCSSELSILLPFAEKT